MHEIGLPITATQVLEVEAGKLGQRIHLNLPRNMGRVMIDATILQPMHCPAHIVDHRIPMVRQRKNGGKQGGKTDQRHPSEQSRIDTIKGIFYSSRPWFFQEADHPPSVKPEIRVPAGRLAGEGQHQLPSGSQDPMNLS